MSRLIDADALEKDGWKMNRIVQVDNNTMEYQTKKPTDFSTIEPEQRWIPVSERLPEKAKGQYWVCTNTGYQCQCRWTDDVYGIGSNGEWAWKIFDIPQYSHVIAWMPLPEPYKERREE